MISYTRCSSWSSGTFKQPGFISLLLNSVTTDHTETIDTETTILFKQHVSSHLVFLHVHQLYWHVYRSALLLSQCQHACAASWRWLRWQAGDLHLPCQHCCPCCHLYGKVSHSLHLITCVCWRVGVGKWGGGIKQVTSIFPASAAALAATCTGRSVPHFTCSPVSVGRWESVCVCVGGGGVG